MNHHQRQVLHALFGHPVSANIGFRDVMHMFEALGAVIENKSGRRIGVRLNGHSAAFSHAHHSVPIDEVAQIRRFLETCGIGPAQFPASAMKSDRKSVTRTGAALAAILVMAAAIAAAQSPSAPAQDAPVDYWQPLWMQRQLWGPGVMPPGMRARLLRHHTYMQYGVQAEYQGAKSAVGNDTRTIEEGAGLYAQSCSSCHGKQRLGDGEARSLLPSSALLASMIQRPISVDEYLLWSISEGGKQFDTEMPAFKTVLSREDIWKIIAYMRAGSPTGTALPQGKKRRRKPAQTCRIALD